MTFDRESETPGWTVAAVDERCGNNWCPIAQGQPMQILPKIGGVGGKRRVRCLTHAIGSVDWERIHEAEAQFRILEAERERQKAEDDANPRRTIASRPRVRQSELRTRTGFASMAEIAPSLFDAKTAAAGRDE